MNQDQEQIHQTSQEIISILRNSIQNGDTETVIRLLKKGGPSSFIDNDGQTALHLAAAAGNASLVSALIKEGCDISIQDFTGHTPLQRACSEGQLEIIQILIKNGINIDHQDELHGNTALHEAAWKGFSQSVDILCKNKANCYIRNRGGFTPLHLACQNGHNESCRIILLTGCRPDIKNNYGDTPLHTSARYGHSGVIRILVSAKCNTSEQNKNGDTALHIAAAMGRRKLTRVLLESGCKKSIQNKQGETALAIAERKHLIDIMNILNEYDDSCKNRMRCKSSDCLGYEQEEFGVDDSCSDMEDLSECIRKAKTVQDMRYKELKSDLWQDTGRTKRSTQETDGRRSIHNDNLKKRNELSDRHRGERKKVLNKEPGHKQGRLWKSPYKHQFGPGLDNFPTTKMDSLLHDEPLRAGEQYFLDLAGNVKKGPSLDRSRFVADSMSQKLDKKREKERKDLVKIIDHSHHKLDTKIANLERKTKSHIYQLNQTMKEKFANERGECLDRMDRRALRERVAIERNQLLRDNALRRDISIWLDEKLTLIEKRHNLNAKNSAILRSMAMKRFSRVQEGLAKEDQELITSRIRRAQSEEMLSSEVSAESGEIGGTNEHLTVSDCPRVRRNSVGDDINLFNAEVSSCSSNTIQSKDTPDKQNQSGINKLYYPMSKDRTSSASLGSSESNTSTCEQPQQYQGQTSSILNYNKWSSNYECIAPIKDGTLKGESVTDDHRKPERKQPLEMLPTNLSSKESQAWRHHRPLDGVIRPIPMTKLWQGNLSSICESENDVTPNEDIELLSMTTDCNSEADEECYKRELNSAQRQFFPSPLNQPKAVAAYGNGVLAAKSYPYQKAGSSVGMSQIHSVYMGSKINIRPMLALLEEEEGKESDLHRQLLNIPMTSDGAGSHDSHNDSGYSTRLGHSAGPSPSFSGSRPESSEGEDHYINRHLPLLDPMAIHMMPPEMEAPTSLRPQLDQGYDKTEHQRKQKPNLPVRMAKLNGPTGSLV